MMIVQFSTNEDGPGLERELLCNIAHAWETSSSITVELVSGGGGKRSTHWKVGPAEIDYEKGEARILVETLQGSRILHFYSKGDTYRMSLKERAWNGDWVEVGLRDFKGSCMRFDGKYKIDIYF